EKQQDEMSRNKKDMQRQIDELKQRINKYIADAQNTEAKRIAMIAEEKEDFKSFKDKIIGQVNKIKQTSSMRRQENSSIKQVLYVKLPGGILQTLFIKNFLTATQETELW